LQFYVNHTENIFSISPNYRAQAFKCPKWNR